MIIKRENKVAMQFCEEENTFLINMCEFVKANNDQNNITIGKICKIFFFQILSLLTKEENVISFIQV